MTRRAWAGRLESSAAGIRNVTLVVSAVDVLSVPAARECQYADHIPLDVSRLTSETSRLIGYHLGRTWLGRRWYRRQCMGHLQMALVEWCRSNDGRSVSACPSTCGAA